MSTRTAPRASRLPDLLARGVADAEPRLTVESTVPAAAVLDADRAPGPVALTAAADKAVRRPREAGIASVGVRRTVRTGAIGYYVSRIAGQGPVGLGSVAGMPTMGCAGVQGAAVATSPLAIAVPAREHAPLLLDMATVTIALGGIRQTRASGPPLPEGAAATADGAATTDPEQAVMPLPPGGAKGSGMSWPSWRRSTTPWARCRACRSRRVQTARPVRGAQRGGGRGAGGEGGAGGAEGVAGDEGTGGATGRADGGAAIYLSYATMW